MALLDNAKNMAGPISEEARIAILAYLQNPTFEGWDAIYSTVISWEGRIKTVWQALCALDRSYEDIGVAYHQNRRPAEASKRWHRIPDAVTLARAIKRVLDK